MPEERQSVVEQRLGFAEMPGAFSLRRAQFFFLGLERARLCKIEKWEETQEEEAPSVSI